MCVGKFFYKKGNQEHFTNVETHVQKRSYSQTKQNKKVIKL